MSAYPETMSGADFCYVEGHLWRGGSCIRCYEQFRCYCGRFLKIEDMDEHLKTCPTVLRSTSNRVSDPASEPKEDA